MANYKDDAHPELTEESLMQSLNTSVLPATDKVPLENLSALFKAPDNPQFTYSSFGEPFERYKVRVDLFKWLIGTVGLTLITFIINWGFRDREQGMNEISQYDKYATELIVLNDNPVKKRMLAQFFANVTPSEQLKDGWQAYFSEVNKEYDRFMAEANAEKKRLAELQRKDTAKLSSAEKNEIKVLEPTVQQKESIINAPLWVPDDGEVKAIISTRFTKTDSKNAQQASEFEDRGFSYLLNKDVDNAIKAFTQSENSYNGYHMVYDIADYLKDNRDALATDDAAHWKSAYATILSKYSWKMPGSYKAKLDEQSKK